MEIRARCNHVGWHQRNRSALPLPTAHLASIGRIDHDILRSLGLIPGASALLIDHATIVHRRAAWRHASHHRADDGGSHGNGSANRRCSRDRMVVIVPAATATAMTFDIDVDVAVDVDVIDASAADIVGTGISPAVVDLRTLPGAATTTGPCGTSTTTTTCGASTTTPTAATPSGGGISVRGYGEAGENESGQRGRKQLTE